ncbi:MAG: hypothetical protein WA628_00660 [Terriglobales bacterium]
MVFLLACSSSLCASGAPPTAQASPAGANSPASISEISIPGPLRSFLRMAGISQKISREDVLPLLARNVYMQGYEGANRPTEFLILLNRYVQQARELSTLAGPEEVLRISTCDDAKTLLHILGYRVRQECGKKDTSLETADPDRAFLTVDSGFPLPALEQTLQGGKTFEYAFPASRVPMIFTEADWMAAGNKREQHYSKGVVDTLLHDSAMARLYWAFSRLDPGTREFLRQSVGIKKLLPNAAVLDFYGSYICVRSGRVIVPGGANAEPAWKSLVGASPESAGEFVQELVAKDTGWLAAYFDVLSRASRTQQAHFTEGNRLRSFYEALRSTDPSTSATRGAFRPAPGLLLLVTRQQWELSGEPHIPGGLQTWKEILRQKSDSKLVREWGKRANRLSSPDQLLQTMVALSRATTDFGPLQIYLVASELDMRRSAQHRLSSETVRLLARKFELFSDQYRVFAEFPELTDASLDLFLDVAEGVDHIGNVPLRGNALGTLQANVGIWQILARQGQIPRGQLNESWQGVLKPFAKIHSSAQVYEAGNSSLRELLRTATGKPRTSQDGIIELLAGPRQVRPEGKRMHDEIANAIRSVLDSQRLVSLDTLHAIGDGLQDKIQGKPVDPVLATLAEQLREFEMPRPIFKGSERSEWAAGIYNNSHTDAEMRADLAKVLSSSASRSQIEDALGDLALFQRDTLVGLNYAYYEPPGAQALHNNPLLVRSHDFSAETVGGIRAVWQAPHLFGEGSPAGGGAHLVGSLADLPYALAEIEQDFIVPQNVQALIWRELVPGLITSAILPRWWGVGENEVHAITLYQRSGEELLNASADNAELRAKVLSILGDRMTPQRSAQIERTLASGLPAESLLYVTPADTLYLAAEFRRRYPERKNFTGPANQELEKLTQEYPEEVSWERLSRDFGVPHPALAQTYGRELLNLPPVPAFAGYSSRLLAESWDSGTLYWARLADETGSSPETLNRIVPELTRRMVENVFATDFEDWPALVRALHETGEEFRRIKVASAPLNASPSTP